MYFNYLLTIIVLRQLLSRVFKPIDRFHDRYINYYQPGLEWRFSVKRWLSIARLLSLRNKHKGARCFIIGNGPSLNRTDLSVLRDEVTFGLNRIYLLFPELGFQTTYFVSVNRYVIKQFSEEIERLLLTKFISWYSKDFIAFDARTIFISDNYKSFLGFSKNPLWQVWEGATVTYVAMQLAYYMGFQQVILIGVDHSFTSKGEPNRLITSSGPDLNHFSPQYFGEGVKWQLPDLEISEKAYRLARDVYEQNGREILDATVNGKLNVFPKIDYRSLF